MPLPSHFAYDTETGELSNGDIRTVSVQICPMSASSLKDVKIFLGEDAIQQFLACFEETLYDMTCHVYNLSYEGPWIYPVIKDRYVYVDTTKDPPAGCWSAIEDPGSFYALKLTNLHGATLRISDDMRRVGPIPMESVAESVRKEHPDWWDGIEQVKDDADDLYNVWWTLPRDSEGFRRFLKYATVDAYSQAMIMRWMHDHAYDNALTRASIGLYAALRIRYEKSDWENRALFKKEWPPLERREQDILEESLMGGFVFGIPGTHRGVFTHIDYSSSYPYEYAFGRLFRGKVSRIRADSPYFKRILRADNLVKWYLVSFDFEGLKPGGLPVLNGKEIATHDDRCYGQWNKKVLQGHVEQRLVSETYMYELNMHYYLYNFQVIEVWYAVASIGDFRPFIEMCYTEKSRPELKKTATREMYKGQMNTGIHGKTITKTRRRSIKYPDGVRTMTEEVNDPEFCALIGFTAMMNARERLIRDCRKLQQGGYRVYMCDTDSIVCDAPESEVRRILGENKFIREDRGFENLGLFEFETDDDGSAEFDCFKCWGLKRYCELSHGQYRKSAFAGMHEELQEKWLPSWETDGTPYEWEQLTARRTEYGKIIAVGKKHAKAEDIYYHDVEPPPICADPRGFDAYLEDLRKDKREFYGDR